MDHLFHHSNPNLGFDGDLGTERQLLVEKQKMCKTRARKFSLETNRRRKALDERRKQMDILEQQMRENILEQRRQQLQDATERFQRAHLPPSQRHRQSSRRTVTNLEDALKQLQCTARVCEQQNSSCTSNTNINSYTPSPKPPTVFKPTRTALSVVEAYTKLLQDQSRTEKLQDHSPQGSDVSACCNSESLSSKDSLENEEVAPSTGHLQCPFSGFFLEKAEKAHPDVKKQDDLCLTSDQASPSGMLLQGDNLAPSRKPLEPGPKKQENSDLPHDKTHMSKASWEFMSVQKTTEADTQPDLHNCNKLAPCEVMSGDREHFKPDSPLSSPQERIVTTGDTAGNTENLECSCPKQETLLDLKEQKNYDVKLLKYPSATEIHSLSKNGNSKDVLLQPPSKPNIVLHDSPTDNLGKEETPQQTAQDRDYLSPQKEPSGCINNLSKGSNTPHEDEKSLNMALLQHARLSNIQSGTCKCQGDLDGAVQGAPVEKALRSVCKVRFIKGILKKQSKYILQDPTYGYGAGHLIFAKQIALAIRDSVELTRAKANSAKASDTVKKKLRWFDEVHMEKEAKEQNMMKHAGCKSSNRQSDNNPEDHQLSLATGSGTPKTGPSVTPAASACYHFTKEAWADVGVQVSLHQERSEEVKAPRSNTRTGSPRVPRRERSARAAAGPVSSRTRKGTVIRPQSATEVSQIAKSQGRMMAPRPPPRTESVAEKMPCFPKTPYGPDLSGFQCKQGQGHEQLLRRSNSDVFISPGVHHIITDNNVAYAPLPPSYMSLYPEGSSKSTAGLCHQDTHIQCRRRGTASSEKGPCLRCTPTEEEISQLWHGVRSALTTKDVKTTPRRQAPENGRVSRKPSAQPTGSGNRRLLTTSQTTQPTRPFPNSSAVAFPNGGSETTTQFHLAEVHAQGLREGERDAVAAMETAQTQKPGQQQGLTNISLEEQKILLSLERLNHQLHCIQEYAGVNSGSHGAVLIDQTFTGDIKVNLYKRCASSANGRSQCQKKS